MKDVLQRKIEQRIELFQRMTDVENILSAARHIEHSLRKKQKILIFGNGGSSTQASHFAAELVNKFYFPRPGLAALALTTDIANITSIANDFDFQEIFSRQIEALGSPGDVAIGISTSGTSANVLEGLKAAGQSGLTTMALCGDHTKKLEELNVGFILSVPSKDTPAIQEIHLFFLHFLAETVEERIFA
jgi:D-sedoheptulose 7-phosphate isomerase